MPGMSANPLIFEMIKFPKDIYEIHLMKWIEPILNESIESYATRLSTGIIHHKPVLIGVSFGGLIVDKSANLLMEISSTLLMIKSNTELPLYMKSAKFLKLYNYYLVK